MTRFEPQVDLFLHLSRKFQYRVLWIYIYSESSHLSASNEIRQAYIQTSSLGDIDQLVYDDVIITLGAPGDRSRGRKIAAPKFFDVLGPYQPKTAIKSILTGKSHGTPVWLHVGPH